MENLDFTSEKVLLAQEKQREVNKERFFKKCEEKFGSWLDVSDFEYEGNRVKGHCKCKICGHEWDEIPETLLNKDMCPECKRKYNSNKKRELGAARYKAQAEEIYKDSNITDIEFYYDDVSEGKSYLRVKFYCHEKDEEGNEHGWQDQSGIHFLKGNGCAMCSPIRHSAYTTEEWVKLAKKKHPEYDYSKTVYKDKVTKVTITCSIHGDFEVNPKTFLHENAICPECTKERLHDEFVKRVIERAEAVHKEHGYIYRPEYIFSSTEKIGVECPKHGLFWTEIANHINQECLCPKCASEINGLNMRSTFDEIVAKAREVHGDKYDYSKVEYEGTEKKVTIICPIHGEFQQTMHSHLAGGGCPYCKNEKTSERFKLPYSIAIERMKEAHKYDNYDYSLVEENYVNAGTKVPIICHKTLSNGKEHGMFMQDPGSHIYGRGCPTCNMSQLERDVMVILSDNNINFKQQYHGGNFLGLQSLDFYLPDYKIGIECQGIQHFEEVQYRSETMMGGQTAAEKLAMVKGRDAIKKRRCKESGVKLIYFLPQYFVQYLEDDDLYATNEEELLSLINEKS